MQHRRLCTALLCFAIAAPAAAQMDGALVSDRPDFTESTNTIVPGHVQVEAGVTAQEVGEEDSLTVGELLVRIGVGERLEARLGVGSWSQVDLPGARLEGLEDPSVGFKVRLTDPPGDRPPGLPAAALLFSTTVPVGSDELTADEWQPEVRLALDWDLTDRFSLGANLGYAYPDEDGERFHQALASVTAGIAATDRLSFFLETYGFSEETPDGDSTQYADTGLTFSLNDNLQLDARIGFGLNDPSPERFVGVGIAARW